MKFYKSAMLVASMLLGFSSVASATSYHGGHHHNGDCGDSGSTCDNPETYSETFDATVSNYKEFGYMDFDAITDPADLTITSATLKISTNANGWWDDLYAYTDNWYGTGLSYLGSLDGGVEMFSLSSDLFDEILAGISFKAWFSKWNEDVFWAQLTVNGEYCPPVSEVPVPAAVWLLGSGLMGMTAMRRRKKTA